MVAVAELPEAPTPQSAPASAQQTPAGQNQNAEPPVSASTQSSSSAQAPAEQSVAEPLNEQKHQRLLQIVSSFDAPYGNEAVSPTAGQKLYRAFRSATSPFTFSKALLMAGYHEAMDDDIGFGWGAEGYGKRAGASYLDSFDSKMLSKGILPSMLHQDPRYFRRGYGTTSRRIIYAVGATVICKHDDSHRWEPNYSNVGGNLAAGALSNYYYPAGDNGAWDAIRRGLNSIVWSAAGPLFREFWPDVSRKFFHQDPTLGYDAQARAAGQARKDTDLSQ